MVEGKMLKAVWKCAFCQCSPEICKWRPARANPRIFIYSVPQHMQHIDRTSLLTLERTITEQGVVAGLRYLNKRAPHRFTGIYQFSPGMLLNVHLIDAFVPETLRGSDVAIEDAYCVLLADRRQISFAEPAGSPCAIRGTSPVISYCGVLLVRADGEPFGSLCHFDTQRCQRPVNEMSLLELSAPVFMAALELS